MSETAEDLQITREDEVVALESIYEKDFTDLRKKDVWKVTRPPEIALVLTPQRSMGPTRKDNISVRLRVKCTERYPMEKPNIFLDNPQGIPRGSIQKLKGELETLSKEKVGEVVIYSLACHVQEFLYEMLENQHQAEQDRIREQEENEKLERQQKEKPRLEFEAEIERRRREMKESRRRQSETHLETTLVEERKSGSGNRFAQAIVSCTLDAHQVTRRYKFQHTCVKSDRVYIRGRCLGRHTAGPLPIRATFTGLEDDTGVPVALTEWLMPNDRLKKDNLTSQLKSLENEMFALYKLEHVNIVRYLGYRFAEEDVKGEKGQRYVVQVVSEYVGGPSLDCWIRNGAGVPLDQLRSFTQQILAGLDYLHEHCVTHKSLRPSSVLLDNSGNVRIADYSVDKRMSDLQVSMSTILGRSPKKADVYQLGLLLLEVYQGSVIEEEFPEVPSAYPQKLRDFLLKCLCKSDHTRWTIDRLKKHAFVTDVQPRHLADPAEAKEDELLYLNYLKNKDRSGTSRFENDFEFLDDLGKGGFGDVLKVRNRLDGRSYAIKRVRLNQEDTRLIKKITREVKLLSRLKHENVVRYYNSWIEYVPDEDANTSFSGTDGQVDGSTSEPPVKQRPERQRATQSPKKSKVENSLGLADNFEADAPASVEDSVEWSVSAENCDDEEEDSDDDENDIGPIEVLQSSEDDDEDEDDDIQFGDSPNDDDKLSGQSERDQEESSTTTESKPARIQCLHIQMELCEKSTLRSAIDAGLHNDPARVWRLFREVVDGLAHIHTQGMIHRDLKPDNLFLDSTDRVKIGDFGLATTEILGQIIKQDTATSIEAGAAQTSEVVGGSSSAAECKAVSVAEHLTTNSTTGRVGTSFYIAPEVGASTSEKKTHYTQKVDIYSLGIIFFEMWHKQFDTAMERARVLSQLRKPQIIFPDDFPKEGMKAQISLIVQLLQHDPAKRPTSKDLLASPLLPAPELEITHILETVCNPHSSTYQRILAAFLDQPVSAAQDYIYDEGLNTLTHAQKASQQAKRGNQLLEVLPLIAHRFLAHREVFRCLERIFCRHGAVPFSTPLLAPKHSVHTDVETQARLLDRSGLVVTLPHDLRTPFARLVAKKEVTRLKRYHVSRVYKEEKIYGSHPSEHLECAFDIITPTANTHCDAELFYILQEIISEFTPLRDFRHVLRVNHTQVIEGLLHHYEVPTEHHKKVKKILSSTKLDMGDALANLGLSKNVLDSLRSLMRIEGGFQEVSDRLKAIIQKSTSPGARLVKKGISELDRLLKFYRDFYKNELEVRFAPTLTVKMEVYSGLVFQLVSSPRIPKVTKTPGNPKRRPVAKVLALAVGGRYDHLMPRLVPYGAPADQEQQPTPPSAVGFSLAFDLLANMLLESKGLCVGAPVEVLVHTVGGSRSSTLQEQARLLRRLWEAGLAADAFLDDCELESLQETCKVLGVHHLVVLKVTGVTTNFRISSLDREGCVQKTSCAEVVEYLTQRVVQTSGQSVQSGSAPAPGHVSRVSVTGGGDSHSERDSSVSGCASSTGGLQLDLIFKLQDTEYKIAKRRTGQIYSRLSSVSHMLSTRCAPGIRTIVTDLSDSMIASLTAVVRPTQDEKAFHAAFDQVTKEHPRYKKYLPIIAECLFALKFVTKVPLAILYSLKDDSYGFVLLN